VFESWAGELTPDAFDEFLLPELTRIANEVKEGCRAAGIAEVPMVIFAKGAHYALEGLAATAYDVIQVRVTSQENKMALTLFSLGQTKAPSTHCAQTCPPCKLRLLSHLCT
jgi:uroporphyrinogen-III decarboxylase